MSLEKAEDMKTLTQRIEKLEWNQINQTLLENGFAMIPNILSADECKQLISYYGEDNLYRSTIDMKRYNFGKGSYRYFKYPLPNTVQILRETFYRHIVTTANEWSQKLKLEQTYPETFSEFSKMMVDNGQTRSTPLILKYQTEDYNCLHQDLSHDISFPYQIVFGLCEQGVDYNGGHLILTQQRPRMQTVPHIISVPKGGAVIFTSNFHPQLGGRGYYRTVFKHGVGKIENGKRYTLGIVFHDYKEK